MATYNGSIAAQSSAGSDVAVALLKPVFDKGIQEVIPAEFKFYKYATKNAEDVKLVGDHYEFAVHLQRNARAESFLPSDVLPGSGVAKFDNAKMYLKRVAQPLALDHELIMLAASDASAFSVRAEALYEDAKDALLRDLNRQACGDGSGIMATISAVPTMAASIQVTVDTTKFFEEDMLIEVWAATRVTRRNNSAPIGKVKSIDSGTTLTIDTVSGSNWASVVATDVIVKKGSQTAIGDGTGSKGGKDIEGLQTIVGATAPTTYQNLSSSTYRRWKAYRHSVSSSANISPRIWAQAQLAARANSNSSAKWDVIFTSPTQALQLVYGTTGGMFGTAGANAYSKDELTTQGIEGQMAPKVNFGDGPVTVESDLDLPDTSIFAFRKDALIFGELHPVQLEKWGGATALPAFDPGANGGNGGVLAADQMWFTVRGNFGCRKRNEFAEIYGLGVS